MDRREMMLTAIVSLGYVISDPAAGMQLRRVDS
jgi:hypothetical protein